eukprot:Gb_07805 [translate_table: standard]
MMMQETGSVKAVDRMIVRQTGERRSSVKPPDEQVVKCPRCDSINTKFCYYNNYSLSQPRHFCKSCRRYWTNGGALRNVPIGGGSRKNKRSKRPTSTGEQKDEAASSSSNSSLSLLQHAATLSTDPSSSVGANGFLNLIPTSAFARLQQDYSLRALGTSDTSSCGIFDTLNNTTNISNPSILRRSCQTLANLPPLETSLLGLHLPVTSTKPETNLGGDLNSMFQNPVTAPAASLNVDATSAASSFNIPALETFNCLCADLPWRVEQQQQQKLDMVGAAEEQSAGMNITAPLLLPVDGTENGNEMSLRYHVKPKSTISCYPISPQGARAEWQPVADSLLETAGAGETGHWNAAATWFDWQHFISAAGALP